jgi:ethanolamine ammonia-lyase small subunit
MLYFCTEPRLPSQIMSYCDIDGVQFKRFFDHCVKRNLLKVVVSDLGLFALVVTERGRKTLTTAEEIIKALGIKEGEKI